MVVILCALKSIVSQLFFKTVCLEWMGYSVPQVGRVFFGGGICFKNKTLELVFRACYDGKNEVKEGSNWKNWVG